MPDAKAKPVNNGLPAGNADGWPLVIGRREVEALQKAVWKTAEEVQ